MQKIENSIEKFGNFHPDKIILTSLIVLGRSSSVFVSGLFDKHPNFITLPSQFYPTGLNMKKSLDNIAQECYNEIIARSKRLVGKINIKKYPVEIFKNCFIDYINNFGLSRKNVFIACYYSFAKFFKMDLQQIRYIVFDTHLIVKNIKWCISDFKNIRFIVTIRDPRSNHLSLKLKGFAILCLGYIKEMYSIYTQIAKKYPPSSIFILKHEDLHTQYPVVLDRLCRFFDVKKTDALNYSSFFGLPYDAAKACYTRSSTNINSSKPDPVYVDEKWKESLSSFEIAFIQNHYKSIFKDFGYKWYDPFENPKFMIYQEVFKPLTKKNIDSSKGPKRFILNSCLKIAKIPILGYIFIFSIQLIYLFLRYTKSRLRCAMTRI
ncbi:MAG: hypothetical protein Q8P57_01790 [Candidatus Pacearchaeota archaeon]|nr:hypothetical protein [Candidatus Pacearchaeota archaeon]